VLRHVLDVGVLGDIDSGASISSHYLAEERAGRGACALEARRGCSPRAPERDLAGMFGAERPFDT
jgi:hypothetical protein